MSIIYYYPIALAGLAILSTVLILIGQASKECPQLAGAARLASVIVTTGFSTIGIGVIALIGAAMTQVNTDPFQVVALAVGIAAIALGIGFLAAAINLRDLLKEVQFNRMPAQGQQADA
ncbi:MAG: hypothetical protein AAGC81_08625 [Pseudomonadota bacterium]